MKQTETIKNLIKQGQSTIHKLEQQRAKEIEENDRKLSESWKCFIERVKKNIPLSIVDYLSVNQLNNEWPPNHLSNGSLILVKILIEGLAPISLSFGSDERVDQYVVPEISSNIMSNERYGWEFYKRDRVHGLADTEVINTVSLPLALAVAEERFQLMQKLSDEWKQKEAEELQVNQVKEPVYVPVTENTADAQAMSAIRAIIREEIHRLAYAD